MNCIVGWDQNQKLKYATGVRHHVNKQNRPRRAGSASSSPTTTIVCDFLQTASSHAIVGSSLPLEWRFRCGCEGRISCLVRLHRVNTICVESLKNSYLDWNVQVKMDGGSFRRSDIPGILADEQSEANAGDSLAGRFISYAVWVAKPGTSERLQV